MLWKNCSLKRQSLSSAPSVNSDEIQEGATAMGSGKKYRVNGLGPETFVEHQGGAELSKGNSGAVAIHIPKKIKEELGIQWGL